MDTNKLVQGVFVGMVCNIKCSFCNTQYGTNTDKNYYTFYSFNKIKSTVLQKKIKGATHIIYEGGDFSIHPDIFKILSFGKTLGLKQSFQTNGVKLSDLNFVKKIKKAGVKVMNFSLHAFSEKVSDSISGVEGSFNKTIKGIINCNNIGIKTSIHFVIIKENINQLEGFIMLMLKLKVNSLNFSMYIPIKNRNDDFHNKLLVDPIIVGREMSNMFDIYNNIINISKGKFKIDFKFHNIGRCIFRKNLHKYNYDFTLDRRDEVVSNKIGAGFYKKKECEKCIYYTYCPSFTYKYIKVYGDSFIKPILN